MLSYCAVAVLALLVGAHADDVPCSKQMEYEKQCLLTVALSPEAQMLKDRMKQTFKSCAPDYPEDCHAQFTAAHDCAISIIKDADKDPQFQESKAKSGPAVDQCFEKYPPNLEKAFMEIVNPMPHPPHRPPHHKRHHKRHHNETSSSSSSGEHSEGASGGVSGSGETNENSTSSSSSSSEHRQHHQGKRHHGCRMHHRRHHRHNATSSSSNENNTSSGSSGGKSGGRSGGSSGGSSGGKSGGSSGSKEKQHMRPECRKTKEQKTCVKEALKVLATDKAIVDAVNTLINQKKKCKQIVQWSCTPSHPKEKKCIFKATKPCRDVFMQKMKTCMQQKGFTLPPHLAKATHEELLTTPSPLVSQ